MPAFSVVTQDPQFREVVQNKAFERSFHDALFPDMVFRHDVEPVEWNANVGDRMVFSAPGLVKPKMKPIQPQNDPTVSTYGFEQWVAQLQLYGDSIDTYMPDAVNAIINMFLRNAHQLGLAAAQSINRLVRNKLYAAGLAGNTVTGASAIAGVTSIRVMRLNGFTTARRPDLANGSPVAFQPVSATNPLAIDITLVSGVVQRTGVTAFTPDNAGDETGPGLITIADVLGATGVAARAAVRAVDRTQIVRVGGGTRVDDVGVSDILRLIDIRSAVARLRTTNVPRHPDGYYHAHFDPVSEGQIFADAEFQRLLTALPDHYMYREFAIGALMGTVFMRNNECPQNGTIEGAAAAAMSAPFGYDEQDPFGGEVWNNGVAATGVEVHRAAFTGYGGLKEYYQNQGMELTEAGLQGVVAEPQITNDGVAVMADRVRLYFRAPQDRLGKNVATTWSFVGDHPFRTDCTTGDAARYKRVCIVEHGTAA